MSHKSQSSLATPKMQGFLDLSSDYSALLHVLKLMQNMPE